MRHLTKTLSILAGAIILLTSCDKDQDSNNTNSVNPEVPSNNMQAIQSYFLNNMENTKQSFTIDASSGGALTSSSGSQITFSGNSFIDGMGQEVTGNITIEFIEIFDKSDMLRLNKPTMGVLPNGAQRPLVSGGEFQIKAFQNGTELSLKAGSTYSLVSNAPAGIANPDMQLFYGQEDGDTLTWFSQDTLSNVGVFAEGNQYYSYLDSLNWINCDYFMNYNGPLTTVSAELPSGFTNNNAMLFMSFDGLNSITQIYGFENNAFTTGPYYEVPVGTEVHFIAVTIINDQPHTAIVGATISDGHLEIMPELTQTTDAQLAADILDLP